MTEHSKPIFAEQLKAYYEHFFPTADFIRWLSYEGQVDNSKNYLQCREFSFTIKESYVRYKSVSSAEELVSSILARSPDKIDIGAVYSVPPSEKEKVPVGKFVPQEKELVFDIDLTDYDDVRFCGCKNTNVCQECFQFANCAMEVLEELLGECFGATKRLWVFSGRRGVHCWVCDESFRKLSVEARGQIADFISLFVGSEKNKVKQLNLSLPIHPTFDTSSKVYQICERYFVSLFIDKWNILEKNPDIIMEKIQANKPIVLDIIKSTVKSGRSPRVAWEKMKDKMKDKISLTEQLEIVYSLVYPRLDINVSKQLNHLLKSPFCVHPKTGLVCVPINPQEKDLYPLESAPSIHGLLDGNKRDIKKMEDARNEFKSFVETLLSKSGTNKQNEQMEY